MPAKMSLKSLGKKYGRAACQVAGCLKMKKKTKSDTVNDRCLISRRIWWRNLILDENLNKELERKSHQFEISWEFLFENEDFYDSSSDSKGPNYITIP